MAAFLSEIENRRVVRLHKFRCCFLRPAGKFSRVVRPVREKPRLRDRVSTLFLKWLENQAEMNSLAIRLACRIA